MDNNYNNIYFMATWSVWGKSILEFSKDRKLGSYFDCNCLGIIDFKITQSGLVVFLLNILMRQWEVRFAPGFFHIAERTIA